MLHVNFAVRFDQSATAGPVAFFLGAHWARLSAVANRSAIQLVAPEKPPITQRPQGLDVCSGVPELP
ncbi:hypothetical protein VDQ42_21595, partial [Xanthomonas campestris pv. campestris]|nr:hypothetical protein [Xanthomonas campestris pv. campestris]MEB1420122.1 hypothetical protein [Xanthomonas campestris pv. campestris]MEB1453440.1 hypothetical protein [Xanthomonas campestris pv. campestris]